MATKQKKPAAVEAEMPQGYASIKPEKTAAFFRVEEGAILEGVLIGRFLSKKLDANGERRAYYQVRVVRDTEAQVKIGEKEYENQTVEPGTIVSIDERAALKQTLYPLTLEKGKNWQVYLKAREKVKLDGGNSFWEFDIGAKQLATDDLPF